MLKVVTWLSTLRDPTQLRQRQCATSYNLQVIAGGILFLITRYPFHSLLGALKLNSLKRTTMCIKKRGVVV